VNLLLIALGSLFAGGILALVAGRRERVATGAALSGLLGAAVAGLPLAVDVIVRGTTLSLHLPWHVPLGSFALGVDPLSAFFLLPILLIAPLAGIYGAGYLREWRGRKNLGACWAFFNLLVACMVLVVTARNAMLFLVAWETMALASYLLVVFEDERDDVRRAGRTYLIATHLGTGALLVLFVLLGQTAGSLDFADLGPGAGSLTLLFALAVIGFGTKAGFVPLHVWLPEAHPASPSHVSALMSGVMIKTGLYGLLRCLTFLGPPPPAWGWTLIAIGVVSAVGGVLLALAQHDLKRVLAYSSVENVGIIALGLGLGLLGQAYDLPAMAYLGYAGGLLHILNHACFKGLLFLAAGAVAQGTHTRDLDKLGGLLQRMPRTGALFAIGAAAICGLPPLNGLVGELAIYLGGLRAIAGLGATGALAGALVVIALALAGGLAAACFARAFGIAFLGEPRTAHAATAHEASRWLTAPMVVLAGLCVALGLAAPFLLAPLRTVVAVVAGPAVVVRADLASAVAPLRMVTVLALAFWLALGLLVLLRRRLLAGRVVTTAVTWDCGYAAPTARMQYTASSFAQPLVDLFPFVLRGSRHGEPVADLFPANTTLTTRTPDPLHHEVYGPIFASIARLTARRRPLQGGQTQLYVLYIAVTLLALLVWKLS
jgi:formate hydrogenlyase subunit 3/multisubunit Na+/H+ antiporter MnhD subunit